MTCPPRQVPGGFGCDAAATRQRASGGVLAENPADARHAAPTVDCNLHHTPVARSATPGRYASEADTDRPEDHDDARAGILRITRPVPSKRRPARLVIHSRHNEPSRRPLRMPCRRCAPRRRRRRVGLGRRLPGSHRAPRRVGRDPAPHRTAALSAPLITVCICRTVETAIGLAHMRGTAAAPRPAPRQLRVERPQRPRRQLRDRHRAHRRADRALDVADVTVAGAVFDLDGLEPLVERVAPASRSARSAGHPPRLGVGPSPSPPRGAQGGRCP